MEYKALLFSAALVLFFPTSLFAQCVINGASYNEGDKGMPCEVCDSTRSATEWSEVICPIAGVDASCQVNRCVPTTGNCQARQLPEHTRCVDPVCSNGSITQTECTQDGSCQDQRVKSCQGFACLDGVSCSTECVDNEDCQSPATCIRQTCQLPDSPDMGGDTSSPDMGNDMTQQPDLPSTDMTTDMKTPDMKRDTNEEDSGTNSPIASGGSCSTTSGSSWFGLVFLGCLVVIRRRK